MQTAYTIYDVKGNIISHKDLGAIGENYLESIDLSDFNKGTYFIELLSDGETSVKKLIKD